MPNGNENPGESDNHNLNLLGQIMAHGRKFVQPVIDRISFTKDELWTLVPKRLRNQKIKEER